jgi:hypothetical protein
MSAAAAAAADYRAADPSSRRRVMPRLGPFSGKSDEDI